MAEWIFKKNIYIFLAWLLKNGYQLLSVAKSLPDGIAIFCEGRENKLNIILKIVIFSPK